MYRNCEGENVFDSKHTETVRGKMFFLTPHHCGRGKREFSHLGVSCSEQILLWLSFSRKQLLLREIQSSWFPQNRWRTGFRLKFRSDPQKTGPKLSAHFALSQPTPAPPAPAKSMCSAPALRPRSARVLPGSHSVAAHPTPEGQVGSP